LKDAIKSLKTNYENLMDVYLEGDCRMRLGLAKSYVVE
jgi:hypothetical protein